MIEQCQEGPRPAELDPDSEPSLREVMMLQRISESFLREFDRPDVQAIGRYPSEWKFRRESEEARGRTQE